MKYLEQVNSLIRQQVTDHDHLVIFGQNVSAGSNISGFTKGITVKGKSVVVNSTNTENSLVGFGFGIMIAGGSAIFFMKQLDFLFLGIDQLVNTYNIIRNRGDVKGSFTIMPLIVDTGFQGPQSSSNDFADFCSIARIPGFTVTNKIDSEHILTSEMVKPGFRIIGISQRLFKEELIVPKEAIYQAKDLSVFQYTDGSDATIVSFNFSFPQAWELHNHMEEAGMKASVFNVNSPTPVSWDLVLKNVAKTGKLIVLDDSKSENLALFSLVAETTSIPLKKKIVLTRVLDNKWLNPVSDQLVVDYKGVIQKLS